MAGSLETVLVAQTFRSAVLGRTEVLRYRYGRTEVLRYEYGRTEVPRYEYWRSELSYLAITRQTRPLTLSVM